MKPLQDSRIPCFQKECHGLARITPVGGGNECGIICSGCYICGHQTSKDLIYLLDSWYRGETYSNLNKAPEYFSIFPEMTMILILEEAEN
jgi:hypothetical protein